MTESCTALSPILKDICLSPNQLKNLPTAQMHKIISKYDVEILSLHRQIKKEHIFLEESQVHLFEVQEQLSSLKQINSLLSKELLSTNKFLDEALGKEQKASIQTEILQSQLKTRDTLLDQYENKRVTQDDTGHIRFEQDMHELCEKLKISIAENTSHKEKLSHFEETSNKHHQEIYCLKEENRKLIFQKESAEYEVRSMKETCNQRDALLGLKESKIQRKLRKIQTLREEFNNQEQEHHLEKIGITEQYETKQIKLIRVIAELQNTIEKLEPTKNISMISHDSSLQDTVASIEKENETLKAKLDLAVQNNEKMTRKVAIYRVKRENAKNEVFRLNQIILNLFDHPHDRFTAENGQKKLSQYIDVLINIKFKIQKIYKSLLERINKSRDLNTSVYSLESCQIQVIEKGLNKLNMFLHEQLENVLNCKPTKPKANKTVPLSATHSPRKNSLISPRSNQ